MWALPVAIYCRNARLGSVRAACNAGGMQAINEMTIKNSAPLQGLRGILTGLTPNSVAQAAR